MLKITSLALGLLTVISIAPNSEAMTAKIDPVTLDRSTANLHSQVILKIGGQGNSRRIEMRRRRELQRQRELEAQRRRQSRRYDRYRRDR
jgi:hypothetical protein